MSKTHARLELRDDRWYITDLDSTNGVLFATLIGTEVEATPGVEIEAGERFLLGDAEVRLRAERRVTDLPDESTIRIRRGSGGAEPDARCRDRAVRRAGRR